MSRSSNPTGNVKLDRALGGRYTLDPANSRIGFVARHAMISKVRGTFGEFAGTGRLNAANPAKSSLQVTVDVASIDTRSADRDNQLRTNDFLDVPNHPEITFVSTSIVPVDAAHFSVTGDLAIKGVTKPVTIDVSFSGPAEGHNDSTRIGLKGSVVVNRKDWGVNWNAVLEAGGVLVSEQITLTFEVTATKDA